MKDKKQIISGAKEVYLTLKKCVKAIVEKPIVRGLCLRIKGLLMEPEQEWKKIADEKKEWREVQVEYLYPIWIVMSVAIILHTIYTVWYNVTTPVGGLVVAIIHFVVYTVGFFVVVLARMSSYSFPRIIRVIEKLSFVPSLLRKICENAEIRTVKKEYETTCIFIAYSEALIFCTEIIENMLPLLSGILYAVNFYCIYVVWQGYWQYMRDAKEDDEDESFWFAISTVAIMYVMPKIMVKVVETLM